MMIRWPDTNFIPEVKDLKAIVGAGKINADSWPECPVQGYWPVAAIPVRHRKALHRYALVDMWHSDHVLQYGWRLMGKGYARTDVKLTPARADFSMHWLVFLPEMEEQTDHENGDMLDNRGDNLRSATPSQNMANRRDSRTALPFTGIVYDNSPYALKKRWRAQITVNYKQIRSPRYATKQEAEAERVRLGKHYFGEFFNG